MRTKFYGPGNGLKSIGAKGLFLCLLLAPPCASQATGPSEYEVKAAFLYNFALYVEWPAAALDGRPAFTVGMVGKDVFGGVLEKTMKDRTAQGKKVEVARFAAAEDIKACHILFVPYGEREQLDKITAALKGTSTLIVTEFDEALKKGSIINFFLEDKRVRIEVNPDAAGRENLRVGAKVLRLARIVKDGEK